MPELISLENANTMLALQYALDAKAKGIAVAEVMTRQNPILEDAPWKAANSGMHNMVIQESFTGGAPQKRQFNSGVVVTETGEMAFTDGIVMVEDYSEADKALADTSGPTYRQGKAATKIRNMATGFAGLLFYDQAVDGQLLSLNGLAKRMSVLDNDVCLGAGAAANASSIYIIDWGFESAYLFYPTGEENYGVSHKDLGEHTFKDPVTKRQHQILRDHFKCYGGLSVQNGGSTKRVCNIDVTDLDSFESYENLVIKLINKMPETGGTRVIYCNSDVKTMFDIRAKDKGNVVYGEKNIWGKSQLEFRDVPIKVCDAISSEEDIVV